MNPAILRLENVSKSFAGPRGEVRVLRGLSLDINAGEFVAMQGASGAGKTTLLLLAGAMLRPETGRVVVNGVDVYAAGAEERAHCRSRHIGFVFQQFHLVPYLSVLQNVLAPGIAFANGETNGRAEEVLARFGMTHRLHHRPAQLSSGERQRVALARALLHRPALVLADEPTGNLDLENGRIVLDALAEVAKEGAAVLLVTHDPGASARAHRVIPLKPVEQAASLLQP